MSDTEQDQLNAFVGKVQDPEFAAVHTNWLQMAKEQAQENMKAMQKVKESEPVLEDDVYERIRGC